jgi:hypothetical protein
LSPEESSRMWVFLNRNVLQGGVVSTSPNPQAGGPPVVDCPRLLIQFIRNYPPYRRPFLYPQPEDAPCRGDKDPLHGTIKVHQWNRVHFLVLDTKLYVCRRPWPRELSSVSVQLRALYTRQRFIFVWQHTFSIKALLCNSQFFLCSWQWCVSSTTPTECIVVLPLQQLLRQPATMLRYTYLMYLVFIVHNTTRGAVLLWQWRKL